MRHAEQERTLYNASFATLLPSALSPRLCSSFKFNPNQTKDHSIHLRLSRREEEEGEE